MKKFQQLLVDDNRNQYGLQFKPMKGHKTIRKVLQVSDQNINVENPQQVQVYIKTDERKALKINLNKIIKITQLKKQIHKKFSIPVIDQIIFLNGKEITQFSSIKVNEKQIFHLINNKNLLSSENEDIQINIKWYQPGQRALSQKNKLLLLKAGQQVNYLKEIIEAQILQEKQNIQTHYEFAFVQSGRVLNKVQTFLQNRLTKKCQIVTILSEPQVQIQTKFINDFKPNEEKSFQDRQYNYRRIQSSENSQKNKLPSQMTEQEYNEQSQQPLVFKKVNPPNSSLFHVNKHKKLLYNKIMDKKQQNRNVIKRKSQSDANLTSSGFKKKKNYSEDQWNDDSQLIRKIKVHKSKQQIEKILSESGSILKQQQAEDEDEKKSIVSESSQDQKQYVPIKQQKQYRPCPLIPQRKMPQSEKMKINMELQRLFGLEPRSSSPQGTTSETEILNNNNLVSARQSSLTQPADQTTKSRIIIRNPNMRNSISAKQSMMKMLRDRKINNRYSEENMKQEES